MPPAPRLGSESCTMYINVHLMNIGRTVPVGLAHHHGGPPLLGIKPPLSTWLKVPSLGANSFSEVGFDLPPSQSHLKLA